MAVFVLAKNQPNFMPVLNWMKQNDPHPLVKQMASVLAGGSGFDEPNVSPQTDAQKPAQKTPDIADGNSLDEPNASPQADAQKPVQKAADIADGNSLDEPNASPQADAQKPVQGALEEKKN
jgi:hypothetical protein